MIRRCVLLAAALAAGAAVPADAAPLSLKATAHGVVDFGDQVPFSVSGTRCGKVGVRIVLRFAAQAVPGPKARSTRCSGVVRVPAYGDVVAAGWKPGVPLTAAMSSRAGTVALRFLRFEVDAGKVVAGSPAVLDGADQDTGKGDKALVMNTGDAVALGRVNVRQLRSVGLRVCIPNAFPFPQNGLIDTRGEPTSAFVSVRQGSADGAALVGPVDVASDVLTGPRLQSEGFNGCYRLVELPFQKLPISDAPELFLKVDNVLPDQLQVNSIDFDGTGAKVPAPPLKDPAGTEPLFVGGQLQGMTQQGCLIADGAATRLPTTDPTDITDCRLTAKQPFQNVVLRMEVRPQRFFDNGEISMVQEVQLRQAGEFGPGGYFGEYAARAHKINNFPDWTQVEIVQLGARYVVSVNGRTVTDHVASTGAPQPYPFSIGTQAIFSYGAAVDSGFGNELFPATTTPSDWGRYWFRDIRVYRCKGLSDPVCTKAADARKGQVPQV